MALAPRRGGVAKRLEGDAALGPAELERERSMQRAEAFRVEVVLEEGEVLFVPGGLPHQVSQLAVAVAADLVRRRGLRLRGGRDLGRDGPVARPVVGRDARVVLPARRQARERVREGVAARDALRDVDLGRRLAEVRRADHEVGVGGALRQRVPLVRERDRPRARVQVRVEVLHADVRREDRVEGLEPRLHLGGLRGEGRLPGPLLGQLAVVELMAGLIEHGQLMRLPRGLFADGGDAARLQQIWNNSHHWSQKACTA